MMLTYHFMFAQENGGEWARKSTLDFAPEDSLSTNHCWMSESEKQMLMQAGEGIDL